MRCVCETAHSICSEEKDPMIILEDSDVYISSGDCCFFGLDKVNRLTEEILTQSHFFVYCLSSLAGTNINLLHPRGECSSIDGPDERFHAEMIQPSLNSIPNRRKR